GREDLVNAIALNSSMVNGARVVGPSVAGLLVAAVGEGWCFFINGVSFLAMRITPRPPVVHKTSAIADIVEGFSFVARTPAIRAFLLLLGMVSLIAMP